MELTPLSLGKSVLNGALTYAKTAIAEEVALQLGIEKDQTFIADELDMMMSFLMEAHEERDRSKVVGTWVKQVRDAAYDVEDSLREFAVHLERPAWWRFACTLVARHRVAKQMKKLRAKVEEVSQRNIRYRLIKGSGSKAAVAEKSSTTAAIMFGIDDARRAAKQDNFRVDLAQLINEENENLKVIAVWGTCGDIGQTSIIRVAYENPSIQNMFPIRAWVRLMHPFSPKGFIQSLVNQFSATEGVEALLEAEKLDQDLIQEFKGYVNENRFFIVLSDLSTIEEWDLIKKCFQNNKKGSRIVVSTTQVEIASLCAGQESHVSELKKLSADHALYAFYDKGSQSVMDLVKPDEIIEEAPDTVEILAVQRTDTEGKKTSLTRSRSVGALESQLIGREKQRTDFIHLILNDQSQHCLVLCVWGMGGIGKTTLVGSVYESPEMRDRFEMFAFITIKRPFDVAEFLRSLVWWLSQKPNKEQLMKDRVTRKNPIASMGIEELNEQLRALLEKKSTLIVLDDLSSSEEWDMIQPMLLWMKEASRIIVTTRDQNIANHCSAKDGAVYNLNVLEPEDALDLFSEKVFGEAGYLAQQKNSELVKEAEKILTKCGGLPLAIVVIGGFLANHPKDPDEWKRLNYNISAELDMNPELGMIKTVLQKSYDGLPFDLMSCFLYLSIFPEDHVLSRRRLVRRWAAEGFSTERLGKSATEIADNYFMELINRSMILPFKKSADSRKSMDSCKVHDMLREIAITNSLEVDMIFRLEEGCSLKSAARHLAISSNWKGDQAEFERIIDLPRLRSLTVFGKFQSFFISKKMRMLRVLDLENTYGLGYHGLDNIGKLLHLTYLSLRGCGDILCLPDTLGNLRQLLTLDIRETYITTLPKTIVKLQKLQYIHAGTKSEVVLEKGSLFWRGVHILLMGSMLCAACCVPTSIGIDGFNRCDACSMPICSLTEGVVENHSVWVPRGIGQMRGLLTLRAVKVGRAVLQDIRWLTGLRKLGVTGINKRNGLAFCLAISKLKNLESLSVSASPGKSGLRGCLDAISKPPEYLQSLKLHGNLEIMPEWVRFLEKLVKLRLSGSGLLDLDGATRLIGRLPKLQILSLYGSSFQSEEICFCSQQTEVSFRSIKLLIFMETNIKSVQFEARTMPKLEQLKVMGEISNEFSIAGLEFLPSINEVQFAARFPWDWSSFHDCPDSKSVAKMIEKEKQKEKCKIDELKQKIREQLSLNENKPILIWTEYGNRDGDAHSSIRVVEEKHEKTEMQAPVA